MLFTAVLAPLLVAYTDHFGEGIALITLSAGIAVFFPLYAARKRGKVSQRPSADIAGFRAETCILNDVMMDRMRDE